MIPSLGMFCLLCQTDSAIHRQEDGMSSVPIAEGKDESYLVCKLWF
jgi:hypothetical protein